MGVLRDVGLGAGKWIDGFTTGRVKTGAGEEVDREEGGFTYTFTTEVTTTVGFGLGRTVTVLFGTWDGVTAGSIRAAGTTAGT